MYINGRKISLDELQEFTNKLIGTLVDDLYTTVTTEGVESIFPSDKYNQDKLLRKMLEFYEEQEQYEKCAEIHKLQVIN